MIGLRASTLLICALLFVSASTAARAQDPPTYRTQFKARIVPTERAAHVTISLERGARNVKEITLFIDPDRHVDFKAEGPFQEFEDRVVWRPPAVGGELRYRFLIDRVRDGRTYDARCTQDWALFRGDHLVPPARVRTTAGAVSESRFRMRLPKGWQAFAPYPKLTNGNYKIENERRRFDRPTGWILAGRLKSVREEVDGVKITIASPASHKLRQRDAMALLRWSQPAMRAAFGELPERLLVIGADDPMWRGGLSAQQSLYIHASRPLISPDGTSTLLHEVVHTLLGARTGEDGDWLTEGFAEYYSTRLLFDSGATSEEARDESFKLMRDKARKQRKAGEPGTAYGVDFMRRLDEAIRKKGTRSLDDVARALRVDRPVLTLDSLTEYVRQATGEELSELLDLSKVPRPEAQTDE